MIAQILLLTVVVLVITAIIFIVVWTRTTEDEPDEILAEDFCRFDHDCTQSKICVRGKLYFTEQDDIHDTSLAGRTVNAVDFPLLSARALNISDVQEFDHASDEYLLVSTSGKQMLLEHNNTHSLVKANMDVSELASEGDYMYTISRGDLYVANIPDSLSLAFWVFYPVDDIHGTVEGISCPGSRDTVAAVSTTGTFLLRATTVVEFSEDTAGMLFGSTSDVRAVADPMGARVYPNNVVVDVDTHVALTSTDELYSCSADRNPWIKRVSTIQGTPVVISQGRCQSRESPARVIL